MQNITEALANTAAVENQAPNDLNTKKGLNPKVSKTTEYLDIYLVGSDKAYCAREGDPIAAGK